MTYSCTSLPGLALTEQQILQLLESKIPADVLKIILAQAVASAQLLAILENEGEAGVARALRLFQTNQAKFKPEGQTSAEEQPVNSASEPIIGSPGPTSPQPNPKPKNEKKKKKKEKDKRKKKGHGRLGAEDFKNARDQFSSIGALCSGGLCPCGQGKLYPIPPGQTFRYEARPLLEAVRHATEKLRCNTCTSVFGALLPAHVTEQQALHRATPEAAATSILARYGLGLPDLRLETLQNYQGHPLPNATQWAISQEAFLRLRLFFDSLITQAANAVSIRSDDAHANVVTLRREINAELENASHAGIDPQKVRTGINNTWVVASLNDGHEIHLSLTGREHQGEICYELLRRRVDETPVNLITDAASKASTLAPFPLQNAQGYTPVRGSNSRIKDTLLSVPIIHSFCLQHLRLRFEEIEKNHPEAARTVLDHIGAVFAHDRQAKEMLLLPQGRLEYHQMHSQPVMNALNYWLNAQFEQRLVEPNSDLGKAIHYAIHQWNGFTEFLRTKNIFLDTNACERDVYFTILHRNNSLHYQTANGATVGDAFMGLFATCRACDINPLAYLGALISFAPDANSSPEKWMPWNYQERYLEIKSVRDQEWAAIDAQREVQGYRQCVRSLSDEGPNDDTPSHRYTKRVDLSHRKAHPATLQQ